ncbi:MAG: hypothetical protein WB624_03040 [Xanthobacteraceae bacterium]
MKNRAAFGLGALVLGIALASAPAFAQDVGHNPLQITLAAHHHHHSMHHVVNEPQMPPQPQPCIHVQTSCM